MPPKPELSERIIGVAFPGMVAGRVLGAALSPLLFAHAPALLVVLSPFLVHLVFVAPLVPPAVYFPIALVITTLQCVIGYSFGSTFGPRAQQWLVARTPISQARTDLFLGFVRRASVFAMFAVPGPILGTIAGVAGISRRTFGLAVFPAQAIWVTAAYFAGEALLEWIAIARTFAITHAFKLTAITLTIVAGRWAYHRCSTDVALRSTASTPSQGNPD